MRSINLCICFQRILCRNLRFKSSNQLTKYCQKRQLKKIRFIIRAYIPVDSFVQTYLIVAKSKLNFKQFLNLKIFSSKFKRKIRAGLTPGLVHLSIKHSLNFDALELEAKLKVNITIKYKMHWANPDDAASSETNFS